MTSFPPLSNTKTSLQSPYKMYSNYPSSHYPQEKELTRTAREMSCKVSKLRKKGVRRGTLNPEAKKVLQKWMFSQEHFAHPYPSEEEKEELALEAGIEVKQLSNWFTNARKRQWQPVLRQYGVEVKNFLSTGRGGPRGSKLEMSYAMHHAAQQVEESPRPLLISPIGSKFMQENQVCNTLQPIEIKSRESGEWKRLETKKVNGSHCSRKRRRAKLNDSKVARTDVVDTNKSPRTTTDVEFVAATSLLGLHRQLLCYHQSVC